MSFYVGVTKGDGPPRFQVVEAEDTELDDLPAEPPRSENGRTITRLFDQFHGPYASRGVAEAKQKKIEVQAEPFNH